MPHGNANGVNSIVLLWCPHSKLGQIVLTSWLLTQHSHNDDDNDADDDDNNNNIEKPVQYDNL